MKLYHTSHQIIRQPDVNYGRRNADFSGLNVVTLTKIKEVIRQIKNHRKAYSLR
ncbi:MAG: DUF3990 domain-containing protein [Ruminococcaceae bacterium]|nr:DUF3990 domain-containing protein [Oscillospiraceae bacterium]